MENINLKINNSIQTIHISNDYEYDTVNPQLNCPIGITKDSSCLFTLLPLSSREIPSLSLFGLSEENNEIYEFRQPLHSVWNLCTIDIESKTCHSYQIGDKTVSIIDIIPLTNYMIYSESRNSLFFIGRDYNPIEQFSDDVFLYGRTVLVELCLSSGSVKEIYQSGYMTPDYQLLLGYIWKMYGTCNPSGKYYTPLNEDEKSDFYSFQEPILIDNQGFGELNEKRFFVWD